MSYPATTDPGFLQTLDSWFLTQPEVLLLIRYSHAAGTREYEFFRSFRDVTERLSKLPHLACITAFKQPQLPIRGVVDDHFIDQCLQNIPDSSEYLVTETVRRVYGRMSWFHYGSGESHTSLREDLEECRGTPVAVGLHPPWLHDTEEIISAVVPDEHGVVRTGVY